MTASSQRPVDRTVCETWALGVGARPAAANLWGNDLYPTLVAKAAALEFSLIKNHPFVDGNKRIGHASLEAMLMLNGFELSASVDESEATVLAVASGSSSREELHQWIEDHLVPLDRARG